MFVFLNYLDVQRHQQQLHQLVQHQLVQHTTLGTNPCGLEFLPLTIQALHFELDEPMNKVIQGKI